VVLGNPRYRSTRGGSSGKERGGIGSAVLAEATTAPGRYLVQSTTVQDWFEARAAVLDRVATPVPVHFDLWDGNILVESGSARRRVGALVITLAAGEDGTRRGT
jgi:hypothetical protein